MRSLSEHLLKLFQRFRSWQSRFAIRPGHVEQNCLHSRMGGTEIIDRVDIAYVQTLLRGRVHAAQSFYKNGRMRLFASDQTRIGDGSETISDPAALQHIG